MAQIAPALPTKKILSGKNSKTHTDTNWASISHSNVSDIIYQRMEAFAQSFHLTSAFPSNFFVSTEEISNHHCFSQQINCFFVPEGFNSVCLLLYYVYPCKLTYSLHLVGSRGACKIKALFCWNCKMKHKKNVNFREYCREKIGSRTTFKNAHFSNALKPSLLLPKFYF